MKRDIRLPDYILAGFRTILANTLHPGNPTSLETTIPVGTTFNIVTNPATTELEIGNISNGSRELQNKQRKLWHNRGAFISTLEKMHLDRHMYLRIDIRSQGQVGSNPMFIPGIYPRIGSNNFFALPNPDPEFTDAERFAGYTNAGTTIVSGNSFYSISFVLRISPKLIDSQPRFRYFELIRGFTYIWGGRTTPPSASVQGFRGSPYCITLLNEVKIDSGVSNYHNPVNQKIRFTLNHASANRLVNVFRNRAKTVGPPTSQAPLFNAYYCGGIPSTTTNYNLFFMKHQMPLNYFYGKIQSSLDTNEDSVLNFSTPVITSQTNFDTDWLISSSNSINKPSDTSTNLTIALVSGASEIYVCEFYRHRHIYLSNEIHVIQRKAYSTLTLGDQNNFRFTCRNFQTVRRGTSITGSWEGMLMFLVPSTETAVSSVIEITQAPE